MPRQQSLNPRYNKPRDSWFVESSDPSRREPNGRPKRVTKFFGPGKEGEEAAQQYSKLLKETRRNALTDPNVASWKSQQFDELDLAAQVIGFLDLRALVEHVESMQIKDPGGITLKELFQKYEENTGFNWPRDQRNAFWHTAKYFSHLFSTPALELDEARWRETLLEWREGRLNDKKPPVRTYNDGLRILRSSYRLAVDRGLLRINPLAQIKSLPKRKANPVTLQPELVKKFLKHAVEHYPETVPYWAVVWFAGLRPKFEGTALRWADIRFDEGAIRVIPPQDIELRTKTKKPRSVPLEDNLRAWLEPCMAGQEFVAPIGPKTNKPSYRMMNASRTNIPAGVHTKEGKRLFKWVTDISRHTYASAFSHNHRNEPGYLDALSEALGHQDNASTTNTYYKNPETTREEAAAFASIFPTEGQIKKLREFFQEGKAPAKANRTAHKWTAKQDALLGTMPDAELARIIGRHRGVVERRREKKGIPAFQA